MLSLHQDYRPEYANTENGGVVTIVDNIQTDVSDWLPLYSSTYVMYCTM